MNARWPGTCPKCEVTWSRGEPIKPYYRVSGFEVGGKPRYARIPKQWVHENCPKNEPPPGVDPVTGEVLVQHSVMQPTLWED
jgi:hypothetical protein